MPRKARYCGNKIFAKENGKRSGRETGSHEKVSPRHHIFGDGDRVFGDGDQKAGDSHQKVGEHPYIGS